MQIKDIKLYKHNAKIHTKKQLILIAESIRDLGFDQAIVCEKDGTIIIGHGRFLAATEVLKWNKIKIGASMAKKGENFIPILIRDDLTDEEIKVRRLNDNKLNESDWDMELVIEELRLLDDDMIDLTGFDSNILLDNTENNTENKSLAERFLVPPFSVISTRGGEWQDRKRAWIAMGIKSEEGRALNLNFGDASGRQKRYGTIGGQGASLGAGLQASRGKDGKLVYKNIMKGRDGEDAEATGTSIFDPALCEVIYSWFVPPGGSVLDPFAGGSVRGIVASKLELQYTGVELRKEQVEANIKQGEEIVPDNQPEWICGDSNKKIPTDKQYDFIFSCPPYADLEVYSDDDNDISNMPYEQFYEVYRSIIKKSVAQLNDDRFACFVVGEVRDKKGSYYNFVSDTISAFKDAGMDFYNEIILVTAIGSLPIRCARSFNAGRKIGKTHQNILVFYKGNQKNIKNI